MGGSGMGGGPREDVDTEKLYEVLGVEKDASEKEIKKAYRKLAIQVGFSNILVVCRLGIIFH